MDKLKIEIRVLKTPEDFQKAGLHYFETASKQNPFMMALGIDPKEFYRVTFEPRIQILAEQELSLGMYDQETGELIGVYITTDAMIDFEIKTENKMIQAQDAFFREGKKRMIEELGHTPKVGEMIESLIGSISPKYMKMNLIKVLEMEVLKHHIKRGYKWKYSENVNPNSQSLYENIDVPYMALRLYYHDFEFEGVKPFEKINFGDGFRNGRPCCLFVNIKLDTLMEAGIRFFAKMRESRDKIQKPAARL